jgi:hypothetical protein
MYSRIMLIYSWLSPYFNAPVFANSNHVSSPVSAYSIAILQAGSFLGRALSGILADRFGVWNMYTTFSLISIISLFAFWTGNPLPDGVVIVGLLGYGYGSGGWITLVAASCGAISPVREYGMRLGMLWSLSSLGIIAGPVICGGELVSWSLSMADAHPPSFDQLERRQVYLRRDLLRRDHFIGHHRLRRAHRDGVVCGGGPATQGRGRRAEREDEEGGHFGELGRQVDLGLDLGVYARSLYNKAIWAVMDSFRSSLDFSFGHLPYITFRYSH